MKLLLYYESSVFYEKNNKMLSSLILKDHFYRFILQTLVKNPDIEVKTVVSEAAYIQNKEHQLIDCLNIIPFKNNKLFEIYNSANSMLDIYHKVLHNTYTDEEKQKFKNYMFSLLGEYKPDIVITYPIQNNILKEMYPESLHIMTENCIFSRPPFMRTVKFEAIDAFNGFLNKYKDEINNFPITEEQKNELSELKSKLRKLIENNNKLSPYIEEIKSKYKYLILFPFIDIGLNAHSFKQETDQFTLLTKIMEQIPKDIGVIVSFHDNEYNQINKNIIKFMKEIYPNLEYLNPYISVDFTSASLNFFEHVDAIINDNTMTGLQSLFWDKKIIAYDKKYSHWFADTIGLDNIEEALSKPTKNKDNLLYWYLTHYAVFEKRFDEDGWYYNYFKNKLQKYRNNGLTFDLYEKNEEIGELKEYIINYVYNHIKSNNRIKINLFGLKISFKRKKFMKIGNKKLNYLMFKLSKAYKEKFIKMSEKISR